MVFRESTERGVQGKYRKWCLGKVQKVVFRGSTESGVQGKYRKWCLGKVQKVVSRESTESGFPCNILRYRLRLRIRVVLLSDPYRVRSCKVLNCR